MDDDLDEIASSLFMNEVPKVWAAKSYPSLKPLGPWVADLRERIAFLRKWTDRGRPASYWISGFFFPQVRAAGLSRPGRDAVDGGSRPSVCTRVRSSWEVVKGAGTDRWRLMWSVPASNLGTSPWPPPARPQAFLTGTLQNHARSERISVDDLSYAFHVLDTAADNIHAPPEQGCYVHGLFLEGARWDAGRKVLAESRPRVLHEAFPPLWLRPEANRAPPADGAMPPPPPPPPPASNRSPCRGLGAHHAAGFPYCAPPLLLACMLLSVPLARRLRVPCVQDAAARGYTVHHGPLHQFCARRRAPLRRRVRGPVPPAQRNPERALDTEVGSPLLRAQSLRRTCTGSRAGSRVALLRVGRTHRRPEATHERAEIP